MRTTLPDQQAVLDSTARVRVVRAAPGSGKTWLVAELIRRELEIWPTATSGIAALSFTRVGGDEIRNAVGHELDHPHYVGTLDSFLFRYVVRPFLRKCYPAIASPRLIPGEWGAEHWIRYGKDTDVNVSKSINLFGCVFIGEKNGSALIAHKPTPAQPLRLLNDEDLELVKKAKRECWKRAGLLTHSDAALWASKILTHETNGEKIRREIVRRFPLIIVDELQDTGYFLGKSILSLLDGSEARGVLVGDPDQAIYEFNGARPDLFCTFESIKGARTLFLSNSQRCPASVATVASHIKDSGGTVGAAHRRTGRAFLIPYTDMVADILRLVNVAKKAYSASKLKVVARQTNTVIALLGGSTKVVPKLGCPPLYHMHRAVVFHQQGRQTSALACALASLSLAIFDYEGIQDEELEKSGLDPISWKRLAVDCMLSATNESPSGTVYEWQSKLGRLLECKISACGLPTTLQIKPSSLKPKRLQPDCNIDCAEYFPRSNIGASQLSGVPVKTVHGVKGETHDITIFVCPDTNAAHCPSVVWWSEDEKHREEKRIAYVAMTRSQRDLIVCVPQNVYQRLCNTRPEFVNSFECMTVDTFVTNLAR